MLEYNTRENGDNFIIELL